MTINDILEKPELIDSLTKQDIKELSYGIKYFDIRTAYTAWGKEAPVDSENTMRKLRALLTGTKQQPDSNIK